MSSGINNGAVPLKQNGIISTQRGVFGRLLGREQFEPTPLTAHDAMGPYAVLSQLPGAEVVEDLARPVDAA